MKKDITITEAKAKLREIEIDLCLKLRQFYKDTGLNVVYVNLDHVQTMSEVFLGNVEMEVSFKGEVK